MFRVSGWLLMQNQGTILWHEQGWHVCDLQEREDDLALLVGEAATFVEKERARANKRARRHRDGRSRSAV